MRLFGVSQKRLDEWAERLSGVSARVGHLEALLDRVQRDIKARQSAPTGAPELDAIAATVDRFTTEAAAESRSHADALEDLDRRIVTLTLATAEGIERVDRAERRIRSTVQRARKELAGFGYESPGLEAEATELRLVDDGGSGDDGVQPLRPDVGDPEREEAQPPGIPGHFSQDVLKALRG